MTYTGEIIKGLPEDLHRIKEEDINLLYSQVERLYLVGSSEHVHHAAEKLSTYKMIDGRLTHIRQVDSIQAMINGKLTTYPIMADISIFRRPQDDMIVATAYCCSMLCHYDLFTDGTVKLFPQVAEDRHAKLFNDSVVESNFIYWCEEVVENRNSIIKQLLTDL